jgi:hypothetical protein
MGLRPYRRNLAMWNLHVGPVGRYGLTRPPLSKRIRRRVHIGVLLTIIGLMRIARAVRADWRPLAGAVLTVVGVVFRSGAAGVLLMPGLLLLVVTLLSPASPRATRARRCELERELGAYSTPADRRDLEAILDLYPDGITHELREILATQVTATGNARIPGARP